MNLRKRKPKREKAVKRLRLDSHSPDHAQDLPHRNRPTSRDFDHSGTTSHSQSDHILLQTKFDESTTTTSQPIKCLTNNHPLNCSTSTKCAKDTDSPTIDDTIKLDDLENSEIIILDSFDSRESDSDTKVNFWM